MIPPASELNINHTSETVEQWMIRIEGLIEQFIRDQKINLLYGKAVTFKHPHYRNMGRTWRYWMRYYMTFVHQLRNLEYVVVPRHLDNKEAQLEISLPKKYLRPRDERREFFLHRHDYLEQVDGIEDDA